MTPSEQTRALGIDYGLKRMGVAVSDEARILAMPLASVAVGSARRAAEAALALAVEKQAGLIVVGMPLNMNGTRGPAAEAVGRFVEQLRAATPIPVETWDERLTSKAAERALIEADVRREKRRGIIDRLAAQIMLQSYLDARLIQAQPMADNRRELHHHPRHDHADDAHQLDQDVQ